MQSLSPASIAKTRALYGQKYYLVDDNIANIDLKNYYLNIVDDIVISYSTRNYESRILESERSAFSKEWRHTFYSFYKSYLKEYRPRLSTIPCEYLMHYNNALSINIIKSIIMQCVDNYVWNQIAFVDQIIEGKLGDSNFSITVSNNDEKKVLLEFIYDRLAGKNTKGIFYLELWYNNLYKLAAIDEIHTNIIKWAIPTTSIDYVLGSDIITTKNDKLVVQKEKNLLQNNNFNVINLNAKVHANFSPAHPGLRIQA